MDRNGLGGLLIGVIVLLVLSAGALGVILFSGGDSLEAVYNNSSGGGSNSGNGVSGGSGGNLDYGNFGYGQIPGLEGNTIGAYEDMDKWCRADNRALLVGVDEYEDTRFLGIEASPKSGRLGCHTQTRVYDGDGPAGGNVQVTKDRYTFSAIDVEVSNTDSWS